MSRTYNHKPFRLWTEAEQHKPNYYCSRFWVGTPTPSFRAMWRRLARVRIKRQHPDSVITKIAKLTSIYDWY